LEGKFELIVSIELLMEPTRVLEQGKFRPYATLRETQEYVAVFQKIATVVSDPPAETGLTPDPGDDYLVSLARAVGAEFLVSGDKHLVEMADLAPWSSLDCSTKVDMQASKEHHRGIKLTSAWTRNRRFSSSCQAPSHMQCAILAYNN